MKKLLITLLIIVLLVSLCILWSIGLIGCSGDMKFKLSEDETSYVLTDISSDASGKIVVPSEHEGLPVTGIDGAFAHRDKIWQIIIPDSVTNIRTGAFDGCDRLRNITVNSNNANYSSLDGNLYNKTQTTLIQYALGKKDSSFTIPNSVQSIGEEAFQHCHLLKTITIPDNILSIGKGAFQNCLKLQSVTIGNGIKNIGEWAFASCFKLKSVTIGHGVQSIGNSAFHSCNSLQSITVDSNNQNYSSKDGDLYDKNQTTLIQYAVGKKATSFTIPDSVQSIGDSAFYDCDSLQSVTIGNGVQNIGSYVFSYCTALRSISYNGTKAEWEKIVKDEDWDCGSGEKTGEYTIYCTDGNISKT